MPRETYLEKGRRYVAEGRLTIDLVAENRISASCRGAGTTYVVGHHPERGWFCECKPPGIRGHCAHLAALQLVTEVRDSPGIRGGTP